ncbi:MAG TPA: hypothetical protein PLP17_01190 [Oligoflexia bacterium]|nr:hypothetical protein [Oligoflexia bacterium]
MKNCIRKTLIIVFQIPVVGYLVRLIIAAVKSPQIIQEHDIKLAELAAALQAAKAAAEQHLEKMVPRQDYQLLESKVTAIEQHVPALLNHISSFNAFARNYRKIADDLGERVERLENFLRSAPGSDILGSLVQGLDGLHEAHKELKQALDKLRDEEWAHVGNLYKRLEFIRDELLYEFRYGRSPSADMSEIVESRIVDQAKYERFKEGIKINLGCGHVPLVDYLNVDRRDLPGVDIIAAVDHLPFSEKSLREIFSAHLIEHFPQEELRRKLLPYWQSLLEDRGVFRAITPDWGAMVRKFAAGEYEFEKMRKVTFGAQDYEGDFHFNMFTKESLARLLEEAGFRDIVFPVEGRINGDCFEMEVCALK